MSGPFQSVKLINDKIRCINFMTTMAINLEYLCIFKEYWILPNENFLYFSDFQVSKTETFQLYHTYPKYKLIWESDVNHELDISLSVKVKYDAHIFFCDTDEPPKSPCYWILLGFRNGESSGIRKCDKGLIDEKSGYPSGDCKTNFGEVSNIDTAMPT